MNPARGLHLVLTCEHAGNRVPPAYRALFRSHRGLLASHRGWDPGALPIARALASRFRVPLLFCATTRLLVEANRSLHHPALFSAITRSLGRAERERIIEDHYTPHRERVTGHVAELIQRGHAVLHVGVHTFTPVMDGVERTAEIGLLYDPARPRERRVCAAWAAALHETAPHLRVRRNYPYRGVADGLTTALRRGFPGDAYLGVELEVNQRLATRAPFRRAVIKALSESLCTMLRQR